jgi:hypothetical protein
VGNWLDNFLFKRQYEPSRFEDYTIKTANVTKGNGPLKISAGNEFLKGDESKAVRIYYKIPILGVDNKFIKIHHSKAIHEYYKIPVSRIGGRGIIDSKTKLTDFLVI